MNSEGGHMSLKEIEAEINKLDLEKHRQVS